MILHVTELRNQLFKVLKMVDAGEDITIIKKDTNKRYRIVSVEEGPKKDIDKIIKRMAKIGFKSGTPQEIRKIIENRYSE